MEFRIASWGQRVIFQVLWIILMLLFGAWVLHAGRYESFRSLTASHSAFGNVFFRYWTHFGDGIFILALAAILAILKRYFLSIGIVGGYLLSGLFAQLGKRLLHAPRPKAFFESFGETVYQVPGVEVHMAGSFPSGHTASAFALAVFLILALPNRFLGMFFLISACLVGYSRIYLSQHFPVDVWAGAMIGTFSGVIVYWRLKKYSGLNFQ
jgi:membrane-associated phospholipid phosphatase